MNKQSWVLTDLDHGVYLPELELGPADFTGDLVQGLRVKKHVLRGGLSDGVDVIELDTVRCGCRYFPRAAWVFIA
jgi:hypothetical protein